MILTNFSNDMLHIYSLAIIKYKHEGFSGKLYIINEAYDFRNRLLPGCKALHAFGNINSTEFWRIFDRINLMEKSKKDFILPQEMEL